MKGCLKLPTPNYTPVPSPGLDSRSSSWSPSISGCGHRKCVAFGAEGSETIYTADEWDRTPTEPARKLSYQDLLELKEIQNSLPRANQPPDLYANTKPTKHYLSGVPVALLPLLADNSSEDSSAYSSFNNSGQNSPHHQGSPLRPSSPSNESSEPNLSKDWSSISFRAPNKSPSFPFPPQASKNKPFIPPGPPKPFVSPWTPPHLAHLAPKSPFPQREKPKFAFLPLLETQAAVPVPPIPPTSAFLHDQDSDLSQTDNETDPPTPSLTNASLDSLEGYTSSNPSSRAPSCEPEDSDGGLGLDLEPSYFNHMKRFNPTKTHHLHALPSPGLIPPSPLILDVVPSAGGGATPKKRKEKKRNFIVVNDIEIELDDDDDGHDSEDGEDRAGSYETQGVAPLSSTTSALGETRRIAERDDTALSETSPPRPQQPSSTFALRPPITPLHRPLLPPSSSSSSSITSQRAKSVYPPPPPSIPLDVLRELGEDSFERQARIAQYHPGSDEDTASETEKKEGGLHSPVRFKRAASVGGSSL